MIVEGHTEELRRVLKCSYDQICGDGTVVSCCVLDGYSLSLRCRIDVLMIK